MGKLLHSFPRTIIAIHDEVKEAVARHGFSKIKTSFSFCCRTKIYLHIMSSVTGLCLFHIILNNQHRSPKNKAECYVSSAKRNRIFFFSPCNKEIGLHMEIWNKANVN